MGKVLREEEGHLFHDSEMRALPPSHCFLCTGWEAILWGKMLGWRCLRASGGTPGWDGGWSHRAGVDTRDSSRRGCPSSHPPRRKVLSADDQLGPGEEPGLRWQVSFRRLLERDGYEMPSEERSRCVLSVNAPRPSFFPFQRRFQLYNVRAGKDHVITSSHLPQGREASTLSNDGFSTCRVT